MRTLTILAAAALATSAPAFAQATATDAATTTDATTAMPVETATVPAEEEDHDFPWGLLGLIGLAGLFGRKRDDRRTYDNNSRP